MALIKCAKCGKEISDKAVACPHCGFTWEKDNVKNERTYNEKERQKVMPKKKNKKLLFIAIPIILIILFFGVAYSAATNDRLSSNQRPLETADYSKVTNTGQTEIEEQLEMVETLFSLNYKEILSEYPNAEREYPDAEDIYNLCMQSFLKVNFHAPQSRFKVRQGRMAISPSGMMHG